MTAHRPDPEGRTPQPEQGRFDHIVIGSSPLMLLQALHLARTGASVLVLDRDAQRGGAWQTVVLESTDRVPLAVENACHVIEAFPGVYDVLEEASGVQFVELDAQPIRIHPTGLIVPYFGRLMMMLSLLRLVAGYSIGLVKTRLIGSGDEDRFLNFKHKLRSLLRHQAPEFLHGSRMKGPRFGFFDFMARLIERCRDAGVRFEAFDVTSLVRVGDRWQVRNEAGTLRLAPNIHITTSANLRRMKNGEYRAVPPALVRRVALVVSVPSSEIRTRQTYAAFWSDPLVSRISRLDTPDSDAEAETRFLVEFRRSASHERSDSDAIVRDKLVAARILNPDGRFRLLGAVDCLFARNVDQLPDGQIDDGLFGYYSNGNLAAGIAAWLERDRKAQVRSGVPPLST